MNNKGADQPAHPRSLISDFVICFLESSISKLATGEISTFKLVSVAKETVLSLALLETPEDRFCCVEAQLKNDISILILGRVLHHLLKDSFISKDCASMCLTCKN